MRDYFGADAAELKNKKLWLFDMDGTIYQEDRLFEGTLDLLAWIRNQGGRYVFISNNSSRSVEEYVEKVHRMGIPADRDSFFISTQAAALYLRTRHPGARVYVQATRSCVAELREEGIDVTEEVDPSAQVVLVGFDMELTMEKLRRTCIMLGYENTFLATNPDLVCPVSFGYVPDCGSMCQSLYNATKRRPRFLGKPEPTMIDIVREKYHVPAEETVVLGDRLYTDIAAGLAAKVPAVCVLSGECTLEDIARGPEVPSWTFGSVADIYARLVSEA